MRQAGSLESQADALRFSDYLATLGIRAQSEPDGQTWAIWVRDEDHLEQARRELEAFRQMPLDPKYLGVEREAAARRREELRQHQQRQANVRNMQSQWRRQSSRKAPLCLTLIGLSVLVAILTDMGDSFNGILEELLFCRVAKLPQGYAVPRDGFEQIKQGQIWRLITPIFVHFGLMHLAMNLQGLYVLGSAIEHRRGTVKFAMMVFSIAIVSNVLQYLSGFWWPPHQPNPLFGGISGVVFGLFGYVWMKTWFDPEDGMVLHSTSIFLCLLFFALCILRDIPMLSSNFSGMLPHVANTAHAVGLVMGVLYGYVGSRLRRRA
jgi:GlpG protein